MDIFLERKTDIIPSRIYGDIPQKVSEKTHEGMSQIIAEAAVGRTPTKTPAWENFYSAFWRDSGRNCFFEKLAKKLIEKFLYNLLKKAVAEVLE